MRIGDNTKYADITRDGVYVRREGAPPKFYAWGSGGGGEAVDNVARAAASDAAEAAAVADSKATEATAAASEAGETASAAAEAASAAQATADANTEALANTVKQYLPEGEYKQFAGKTLESEGSNTVFGWHLGQNSAANTIYLELNGRDANNNDILRFRADVLNNSGESRFYTRHGTQAECYEAGLSAGRSSSHLTLKTTAGDTLKISSSFIIEMKRGDETRTIDLWALAAQ